MRHLGAHGAGRAGQQKDQGSPEVEVGRLETAGVVDSLKCSWDCWGVFFVCLFFDWFGFSNQGGTLLVKIVQGYFKLFLFECGQNQSFFY